MADTKNVPLLKEGGVVFSNVIPSEEEQEVIKAVFRKFTNSAEDRNRNFANFDGLNLIDYIQDSVHRTTTNTDVREDIEDWQARIHDPFTRNKVMAVLGKVVQVLPIAEFVGRGDEDIRKGQIITNLYEYSEEVAEYEEFLINYLLEAIVKGTAIGYEGHEKKEQLYRDVVSINGEVTVRDRSYKCNKLYADLVKLEDFYPSSVGIRKIADMPYCFWRQTQPYQKFLEQFASFERSTLVQPFFTPGEKEQRPWYLDYISPGVAEGEVEIIRYYNKDTDEYVIIANGVWLNPVITSAGMKISPLPFEHKDLPFFDCRFEIIEPGFFYGKSLPDKLKTMQDVLNVLTNMLLDQSFLTIFPPMLTNGFDSIEDDYLRPGRRTPVDTQGLPINQAYMKLDLGTPSGWHQYILEYTRKIMEEASIDRVQQGVAGVGDRTTAQEIRVAAEGVASMLGLFGRLVKYSIKRKSFLRAKNILQFWTDPEYPVVEAIMGEGSAKETSKAFNVFKMKGVTMSSGKRGGKIIEFYRNKEEMPTKEELKARTAIYKAETGKDIEIMAIRPDYIRNLELDVMMVANPKNEHTKESEKAMQLEKARVYLSFFPDLIDREELLAQTAEKMGDDPSKIISKNILNPQPQAENGAQASMMDGGVSTLPQGNMSNNTMRGMRSGEGGANQMEQLQAEMMG